MKIIVSAPSKLHLSGEHSVVYGKPAVLVATDRRLYVTISNKAIPASFPVIPAKAGILNIKIPGQAGNDDVFVIARKVYPEQSRREAISSVRKSDKYINHICSIFEKQYNLMLDTWCLNICSDIPQGRGMGSSASLAVALVGALTVFYKKPWDLTQINKLAYQAEKFIHSNSSGGDVSIATYGGILWYRKELEFLKTFWSLPFKFPKNLSDFVLIDTGRSETTGDLVKKVAEKLNKNQKTIEDIFNLIEKTTKQIVMGIKMENIKLFTEAILNNQCYLEKLGVVSIKTKKLISEIKKVEGIAKISGAGGVKSGSGIVICFHKNTKIIEQIAQKYNYPHFKVKLGGEGVRIDEQLI